jgi:two-component system, NtrC family, response regulator HydG
VDLNRKSVACNISVVVTFKKTIEAISSDVLKAFLKYPWPGNVRELEHIMEHAFVLCSQNIITFDHLPPDFMSAPEIEHRSPDETPAVDSNAILEPWIRPTGTRQKQAGCWG